MVSLNPNPGLYFKTQMKSLLWYEGDGEFLRRQLALCVYHIVMKTLSNIWGQPDGLKKKKEGKLGQYAKFSSPVGKVIIPFLGIFWSSSFGQNMPKVCSPRLLLGSDWQIIFQLRKIISAAGAWQFHTGSFLRSLPGNVWEGEGKAGLAKSPFCVPGHLCSGGPSPVTRSCMIRAATSELWQH